MPATGSSEAEAMKAHFAKLFGEDIGSSHYLYFTPQRASFLANHSPERKEDPEHKKLRSFANNFKHPYRRAQTNVERGWAAILKNQKNLILDVGCTDLDDCLFSEEIEAMGVIAP
eukprot:gene14764-4376_t